MCDKKAHLPIEAAVTEQTIEHVTEQTIEHITSSICP
jgi:hypothetical protein